MILGRLFAAVVVVIALAAPAAAAPLEAYGRLPTIEDVAISPDGTMIAAAVTNAGEERQVIIRRVGEAGPFALVAAGREKVRGLRWADNGHVLITVSATQRFIAGMTKPQEFGYTRIYDVQRNRTLPVLRGVNMFTFDYGLEIRRLPSGAAAFVTTSTTTGLPAVYRTPVAGDGDSDLVAIGEQRTSDLVLGDDGQPIAQLQYDDASGRWRILLRRGSRRWEPVSGAPTYRANETPGLGGYGRTEGTILVAGWEEGRDFTSVRELNLATGAWSEPVAELEDAGSIRDPVTRRLLGTVRLVGDEIRYRFFNPADQQAWNQIRATYPNQQVTLASWSDDRRRVVVLVDSPTDGPAYALVDLTARTANWLGPVYAGLTPADISPVRAVTYQAADGLTMHGYLTLPRGRDARNLPLIVLPHGGPAARDTPGFDWWSQALASRGYAVFRPNFRGSEGYGWTFMAAGFGQWGRKMQTDVSDGVRHLAREGIIDPARVCIVGASYGGYAAMAGAAVDTGVYRCASAVAGVSDLSRMLNWARGRNGETVLRYWQRFMGADSIRDRDLAEISALQSVDRITIPVQLIHGRDDTVVPFEQSSILADALRRRNKVVEMVVLDGEDHWLSSGRTRLQMLTAQVAFLERYNPPDPAPAAPR